MKISLVFLFLLFGCSSRQVKEPVNVRPEGNEPETVVIADFESGLNSLGGEIGVYGDGEPDWGRPGSAHSWYYEPGTFDYSESNVYEGRQSFRLINGEKGINHKWASFSMNMGPIVDPNAEPVTVKNLNLTSFSKLVFYVKGKRGGERFNVIFRDTHARDYSPQARVTPFVDGAPVEWTKVEIPFSKIAWRLDLENLSNIGLEFGSNLGNRQGAMIFIDDFRLVK